MKNGDAFASIDDDDHKLALFLMHQQCLGDRSMWASYLELLPAHVPAAFLWTDRDLAGLTEAAAPGLAARARRLRIEIFAAFNDLVARRPNRRWILCAAFLAALRQSSLLGKRDCPTDAF